MSDTQYTRPLDDDAMITLLHSGALNLMVDMDFACRFFPAATPSESWEEFQRWIALHTDKVQWELLEADPTNESGEVLIAFAPVN